MLYSKKTIQVRQIDDYGNPYFYDSPSKKFNKKLNDPDRERILYLRAGEHELSFNYRAGSSYANLTKIKANFEAGKSYDVLAIIEKGKVSRLVYDIQYSDTHESILPKSGVSLKQALALKYVEAILQPVSEGKTITLNGNEPEKSVSTSDFSKFYDAYNNKESDYIIEYNSDLTGTYTEKGKTYKSYIGFEATKALIYIKFDEDQSLSKEDFLKLSPEECDRVFDIEDISALGKITTVTVSRSKPDKKGTITLLSICKE